MSIKNKKDVSRNDVYKAPFPWFGGKSKVADVVWSRFGDVGHYVEPFAGSLAVLLGRHTEPRLETINDADRWITNFWRAVRADPDGVAYWANNPVIEDDLTARHIYLVKYVMPELAERIPADPEYYDVKAAGWWVWGICSWIGSNWCSGKGCWTEVDGRLVKIGGEEVGVNKKRVTLNRGHGVNRQRVHLSWGRGIDRPAVGLLEWMQALSARLRRVRICNGDWSRVVTAGAMAHGREVGIFLDPPYSQEHRLEGLYNHDSADIYRDVLAWCRENGGNRRYRIALCGYEGEHDELKDMGWSVYRWKAKASYQSAKADGQNQENRDKERIWFSPNCLQEKQ
jgi:site-specific DNA-adenine methylase